jgi:hypothetical protein
MTYVKHQPCPACGSRDNLAVYTDHEYCFGCGHIEFYTYHPRRIGNVKESNEKIVSLPEDIAPYIPAVAESWIKKYDLTLRELYDNNVVWSDYRQLLIFPYFDEKHFLWGWQGRYFGDDPKHPKWTGKGNFKEQIKIYLTRNKESSIIVLTEDIISTIKIQRLYNSSCLHGSYIDINKYSKIYNIYKPKEVVLWLDKDKQKESYLFSLQLNKIGIPSRVVSTNLDPKCYTTSEIKEIIEPKATGITSVP